MRVPSLETTVLISALLTLGVQAALPPELVPFTE
jgi:hypothetical protein